MGREPDQVGSSGKVATSRLATGGPGPSTGRKRFPGNKKDWGTTPDRLEIYSPGMVQNCHDMCSTRHNKKIQDKSYIKTLKELKTYIGSN